MKSYKPLILPFSKIRATDTLLVGGKGANLGEMTHAGFPVPEGFCFTTFAFTKFMTSPSEAFDIYQMLDKVTSKDVKKVRVIGKQIRQKLLEIPMPIIIATEFRKFWEELGTENAYSVRSSATAEDLPDASFAGQQDTYLNVVGEENLLEAVKKCWVSLFTDRAILYRFQNNFSQREVQLSVVVQKMVLSEKSGILFTADPLTGHRHTLSIDASYGLGEALVSGLVNPDAYQVDKLEHKIIRKIITDKQIAIYSLKEGGTREEKLDKDKRKQAVLTDKQILALSDIACKIEAHYSSPQDIEWALFEDKFYVLQSRPITSLYPIDGIRSTDDSLHIYFSFGHQQMMTNTMSPLGLSTYQLIFPFPLGRSKAQLESPYMRRNGGRLFIDLTLILQNRILKKITYAVASQFDALAPKVIEIAMKRPNFKRTRRIFPSLSLIKNFLWLFAKVMRALWWQDLVGFIAKSNDIIDKYIAELEIKLRESKNNKEKVQNMVESFTSVLFVVLNWIPQFISAEVSKRIIPRIVSKDTKQSDIDAISLALEGNVVTKMNSAIGDLADTARLYPEIYEAFKNLEGDFQLWKKNVSKANDSEKFLKKWNTFLDEYGSRGPSEIDIMSPHWYENPLPLLLTIFGYLQKEAGSHRIQHQKLVQAREDAVKKVLEGSRKGVFGWIRTPILKRLIFVVQEVGGVREHGKFLLIRVLRVIKDYLKDIGDDLTKLGKISKPGDIYYLSWPELTAIWEQENDVKNTIKQRKADLVRFQKMSPPVIITSDGESPIVEYEVGDIPSNALVGNPVSGGVKEGLVHVVSDPQKETLKPGEILVTTFTDPGWTPLFINAGGLILEVGGVMTHGSVVAREYGIPAVVGVKDASKILKTGQKVRINGNRGVIEIL